MDNPNIGPTINCKYCSFGKSLPKTIISIKTKTELANIVNIPKLIGRDRLSTYGGIVIGVVPRCAKVTSDIPFTIINIHSKNNSYPIILYIDINKYNTFKYYYTYNYHYYL